MLLLHFEWWFQRGILSFVCLIQPPSVSLTDRRVSLGRYHSCGDNHGIRPPKPEQYLTPLQQKEVAIRHLKTKLLESDNRVHDRLVHAVVVSCLVSK